MKGRFFKPRLNKNPVHRILYRKNCKIIPSPFSSYTKPRLGLSRSVVLKFDPQDNHFPMHRPYKKYPLRVDTLTKDNINVFVWTNLHLGLNIDPHNHIDKWLNQLKTIIEDTDYNVLKSADQKIISKIINEYRLAVEPHEIILNLDLSVMTSKEINRYTSVTEDVSKALRKN